MDVVFLVERHGRYRRKAAVEVRLVDDGAGAAAAAPVLDAYGISSVGASTFFDTNCGPDKICVPDLQLQVTV